MSISILPGTQETFEKMKGQHFVPHNGEGVVFIKLAMLKPDTIENGDPAQAVDGTQGVILCGQLSEIRAQLNKWFDEAAAQYGEQPKKQEPRW